MTRVLVERRRLGEIVRLLAEEIVTVRRSGENAGDYVYDVTFRGEEMVSGRPRRFHDDSLRLVAAAYTSVPPSEVYRKVQEKLDAGIRTRRIANGPEDVAAALNGEWKDMLDWPGKGSVGRGELAAHLAFDSRVGGEPDFVSADGSVKLSMKYFGGGSGTARFKEGKTDLINDMNRVKEILGLQQNKPYGASALNDRLERLVRRIEGARERGEAELASRLEGELAEANELMEKAIADSVNEGGATSGLLAVTDGGVEWIPDGVSGRRRLGIVSMRGNRLELALKDSGVNLVNTGKTPSETAARRELPPGARKRSRA